VNVTAFLERYPQFRQAGQTLIEACLADAALMVNPDVYGDKADYATGLFAAQMLAASPYGMSMRLEDDKSKTIFDAEVERLKRAVLPRILVT
jgi:hypothetical protein